MTTAVGTTNTYWTDHLALWAKHRADRDSALPLERCVVKLSAPEFAGDQLLGIQEMADLAGIAASTLRAYISRGEGDVPLPQATISGRSAWSRPVAQDWGTARSRSTDSVVATLATGETNNAPGVKDLWDRYTEIFRSELFSDPATRKRWAIRWRGEEEVHKVAHRLAWTVAADLDHIIPTSALPPPWSTRSSTTSPCNTTPKLRSSSTGSRPTSPRCWTGSSPPPRLRPLRHQRHRARCRRTPGHPA
ncbi:hypothetical protein E1265_30585 [Streptomyces sp. 8K308]|uniref:hypothetical protein n=1 Tax=Streptomyces sp. 8K308 TaxID=2530388 RepID=UPI00104FFCE9|nr:hypothetical protein [Streptomyces sp. 8K308]TDC10954.1 hypothetical protein E1265_30585 [Streptomyces sp. 8K308]